MTGIENLDQIIVTITPLVLAWIQVMKWSPAFWDNIKKLLPYLTVPVAILLVYVMYWLDLMQSTIVWFIVWLSANWLYDQGKPMATKMYNVLPAQTKSKIDNFLTWLKKGNNE